MRSAVVPTPFAAVFRTEVLYNLKRVVPYALMVLFSANAVLWWGWGPAVARGWAVNSDFYIVWLFGGFSFMTTPLFVAVLMGDPVVRDFRTGIDPLIFSKPVRRAEYLLAKFCGNFFVLVCCQACFALTPLLLQATGTEGMVVLPPRVLPYLQHFFFFVVVSSLALAALFFTVGTLTRNVKVVYGLAVSLYPLYVAWQLVMKGLPPNWRVTLDPLLFNVAANGWHGRSAEWLNHLAVGYDAGMIANRVFVLGAALALLALLNARFSINGRAPKDAARQQASILGLGATPESVYVETRSPDAFGTAGPGTSQAVSAVTPQALPRVAPGAVAPEAVEAAARAEGSAPTRVALPEVKVAAEGWRAGFAQFAAALAVEFRLLRAERSLVVVAPLAVFLCVVELAAYEAAPQVSYSAAYAARTADALLLFLFGVAVFYAGETMHRDRELRVEPVLWATPAPDFALLFSKFSATLLLSLSLVLLVAAAAAGLQLYKGHAPLELSAYLKTYAFISVPAVVFMCAASVASNVLLRDKYLSYAVCLALGGAVYYLNTGGHGNPLLNPVLYNLWTPQDLFGGASRLAHVLTHRLYCVSLSAFLLSLAFLFFGRNPAGASKAHGRLGGRRPAILAASSSALLAAVTGFIIVVNAG